MDVKSVLANLGLSDGEINVYLALLKLGSSGVSKIKEETTLHRTTIYDFLEKLLNKGLVSYVIKNNIKYYSATHPGKLSEYLVEKQKHLTEIMPQLLDLAKFQKEDVKVEIYKGKEGLKTVMLDCIRTKKEVLGMGIDEVFFKKELPIFIEQYQRMIKENKIHERILTRHDAKYLFDKSNTDYKFLPPSYFSPTSTLVYGNKIQIVMWEPSLTTLLIENNKLAESYRNHFESLWGQESMVFRGDDEVKSVFEDIINTLKKGEECLTFGAPSMPKKWVSYFDGFSLKIGEKGAINKVIFDEDAKSMIEMSKKHSAIKLKILPKEYMTPSEVDIYGDKIVIVLWSKIPQAFVINNKKISYSFRKYFELLWNVAKS